MKFVEGFLTGFAFGVIIAILWPALGDESCPRPGDGRRDGACFAAIE